jgi:hypothetical protein
MSYPRNVEAQVLSWRFQKAPGHFGMALRLLGARRAAKVYSDRWVQLSAAFTATPRRRAPVVVDLAPRDPRLPPAGTTLERLWGNAVHQVTVGDRSFAYQGLEYGSLSAVAKAITGEPTMNGFAFFGLDRRQRRVG